MKAIRARWIQHRIWVIANRSKVLIEMPRWYLAVQTMLSTFIAVMLSTTLISATPVFIEAYSHSPGWLYLIASIWLTLLWVMFLFALIASQAHGRALGELLFNSPVNRNSQ